MIEINQGQLISVVVITYNSSAFILETLESIKDQSFQNIELIISDDFSSDDTIKLCENWLEKNGGRFVDSIILTTPINTGIPANANRGVRNSSGEWIKLIAGDDVLCTNAITDMVNIVEKNKFIEVLLTQVEIYKNNFDVQNFLDLAIQEWQIKKILTDDTAPQVQLEYLLKGFPFPGPGFFISRSLMSSIGGYDENYPYVEDMPFCLKVLKSNKKIYFRPVVTVKYRKHSVNSTSVAGKVLPRYYIQYFEALVHASKKFHKKRYFYFNYWDLYFGKLIFHAGNSGLLAKFLNNIRIYIHPKRAINFFNLLGIFSK